MIDPERPKRSSSPAFLQDPCFQYAPQVLSSWPIVTVVTPFYNPGAIFSDTACSVIHQSLQQWEWLIINDGSTDAASLALLDEYRVRDPRIKVIDHPINRGLSAARNTGFAAARTPYVVQLDSDDLLEPTAAEKWAWFLESYPEFSFVKGYTVGFGAREYLWRGGFHGGSAFLEENLIAPTSAVRTRVHRAVGGYDESLRSGLEDWEFWLRCANAGYWGDTVPEYLDWYRRRPTHSDRWANWDNGRKQRAFAAQLRRRYPHLWNGEFPRIVLQPESLLDPLPQTAPWDNVLYKQKSRLLLLVEALTGDPGMLLCKRLTSGAFLAGWEVSVLALQAGELTAIADYASPTPDVFTLPHFLRARDYLRFLRYFLGSRQIDAVVIEPSTIGYLFLPELRRSFPRVSFVSWWNGVHEGVMADLGACGMRQCDWHFVTTPESQAWLMAHGADPKRILTRTDEVNVRQGTEDVPMLSFLQEAIRQQGERPPICEFDTATMSATMAVALAREQQQIVEAAKLRDELPPRLLDPHSDTWQTLIYYAARRFFFPYYRAASEQHKKWLLLVKDGLKRLLLQ